MAARRSRRGFLESLGIENKMGLALVINPNELIDNQNQLSVKDNLPHVDNITKGQLSNDYPPTLQLNKLCSSYKM